MSVGLRGILLIVAVVCFLIAAFSDDSGDLLFFGLAAFAGAFLLGDLPMGGRRS